MLKKNKMCSSSSSMCSSLHWQSAGYSSEGVEAIVGVTWDKWGPGEHYLATHKGQIWSHTSGC